MEIDEENESKSEKPIRTYFCMEMECSEHFETHADLKKHRRAFHAICTSFKCEFDGCDKVYKRNQHLTRHVRQVHAEEKDKNVETIKCTFKECRREFSSQHTLYKHIRGYHQNRTYKCSHCDNFFKKNQHLKIHEYEHTKIKPFKCGVENCNASFLVPSKLRRHLKVHRGYKCEEAECTEIFYKWTLLLEHRREAHIKKRKLACSKCNQTFTIPGNLNIHMDTHKDNPSIYHCPKDSCKKFYYQLKNLRQHIKIDHDNVRIPCSHDGCEATFKAKSTMKKHLKIHSPDYQPPDKKKKKPVIRKTKKKPERPMLENYQKFLKIENPIVNSCRC